MKSVPPRLAGLTVVGRAAQRPRYVRDKFGKAKVGDLDVPVCAQQQVFRLEIAIDDVEPVQIVERESHFGRVEFRDRVGEALGSRYGISHPAASALSRKRPT